MKQRPGRQMLGPSLTIGGVTISNKNFWQFKQKLLEVTIGSHHIIKQKTLGDKSLLLAHTIRASQGHGYWILKQNRVAVKSDEKKRFGSGW